MSTYFEKDASRTLHKTKKFSHSILLINYSALSQLEFTKCESYSKPTTKIRLRSLEKFIDCPAHMKRPFFLIVSEVNRVNYTIRKRCVAVVLWVAWVGAMWVDSCWVPPPPPQQQSNWIVVVATWFNAHHSTKALILILDLSRMVRVPLSLFR